MCFKRTTGLTMMMAFTIGLVYLHSKTTLHLNAASLQKIRLAISNTETRLHKQVKKSINNLNEQTNNELSLETIDSSRRHMCSADFKQKHLMGVTLKEGRIGNRLFQLFTLLATSKQYCYTPLLTNFRQQLGNIFKLDFNTTEGMRQGKTETLISKQDDSHWKVLGDTESRQYYPGIKKLDTSFNWTLQGYLQSWQFFVHQADHIRSIVKFQPDLLREANDFINYISAESDINICVHVRRGDFLSEYYSTRGWCVADKGYLEKAVEHYSTKFKGRNINYIYISDDIGWCMNNSVGEKNVYFSPFATASNGPEKDLALMSLCDHNIITGGTFGWMGAWLNAGGVVYYEGFPRPGSWLDRERNRTLYYPPTWIGM